MSRKKLFKEKRKNNRLNIISFAESEVYSAAIIDKDLKVNKENFISQSFFMVFDRKTNKVVGSIIDISIGGLLIICQVPLEKGSEYHFRMDFSSIMNFEKQILFDVRCAWVINKVDIECYISGFEFIKINRKDIEIIKQVIDRFSTEG